MDILIKYFLKVIIDLFLILKKCNVFVELGLWGFKFCLIKIVGD